MTDLYGGRSPGSTIEASEMDDHRTAASSPTRADPRTTLQHVLGDNESAPTSSPQKREDADMTEDENPKPQPSAGKGSGKSGAKGRAAKGAAAQKEASAGAGYSGHKVRHLKKDDGEPLWRKDIQYEFLWNIFDDDTKCFTNSYDPELGPQSFAEIYIDAMARSSKTSKILRDKLMSEHEPAKNMAMVCLLVNLGRMNTTLNCELYPTNRIMTFLTNAQSSRRCAHSYEHTTPSRLCRHNKTRIPISSCRMPRG